MHGAMSYYRLGRTHTRRQLRELYVPPPRHFLPVMLRLGYVARPTPYTAMQSMVYNGRASYWQAFGGGSDGVADSYNGGTLQAMVAETEV